jgi:YspA, cpYpsA-related SLOG family
MNVFNVAVIGSRGFHNYTLLCKTLDGLRRHATIQRLTSGGARGADTLAERYAREHRLPIDVLRPDYARHGKGAPLRRSVDIITACDFVVAFWDGRSPGTRHAITEAKRQRKQCKLVRFINGRPSSGPQ